MDPEATNNQQTITTPVSSVPPTPQPKSKLPLILGVLVLFGVVGILVFFSKLPYLGNGSFNVNQPIISINPTPTPTADPTANWKTYTNKAFGYQIKYPEGWFVQGPYGGQAGGECMDNVKEVALVEFSRNKLTDCGFIAEQLPPQEADLTIWVLDKPWKEEEIPTTDALGKDISEATLMAGEKATKTPFTEKSELPNVQATRIYFNHNGRGYLIFLEQTDKKGAYDSLYDQILSTFKFTDEKSLGEKVFCNSPRPEACTMECVAQPSYVCGSNGKFYCNKCVACSDSKVEWYIIKNEPCEN